jgi:hypothetical protein
MALETRGERDCAIEHPISVFGALDDGDDRLERHGSLLKRDPAFSVQQ